MLVTALMVLIGGGAAAVVFQLLRSFTYTSAQLSADMEASLAVQKMARDLQEAKQVDLLSATSMRVYYPQLANGLYTRALDTANYIDYYRGELSGPSTTGTKLIRKPAGGTARIVCEGVVLVNLTSPNPTTVDVSIDAVRSSGTTTRRCDMVHRAIFLRNY
ncbi:MAG: hypothetical protein QOJ65_1793 [Fimbriimonadaceae bacterium]|nr:hypothetical protein [Fimbriimonadaceae bacterium]